jgi:hypothetical protein
LSDEPSGRQSRHYPDQTPTVRSRPARSRADPVLLSDTGRFGRMFSRVHMFEPRPESLLELGAAMIQELENGELDKPLGQDDDDDENTASLDGELRLPAGYTYFGQFVDHDITFDPVSSLECQNDPDALTDFRSPRFDLDSLYGRGPCDQPYLYEPSGVHLALGPTVSEDPRFDGPDLLVDARFEMRHGRNAVVRIGKGTEGPSVLLDGRQLIERRILKVPPPAKTAGQ